MYRDLGNGGVQITLTRDDYDRLLIALGYALGAARACTHCTLSPYQITQLLNRLNEGNSQWTPYEVEKPWKPKKSTR